MKSQLIALFVIFNLCYGDDDIIINNTSYPLPPDVGPEPQPTPIPSPNSTTIAPNSTTVTPKTTTISPNSTTTTPITTTTTKPTTITPNTTTITPNTTTITPKTTTITPNTTTISPNITTTIPTLSPSTTKSPPIPPNNRKFDGPSFVGGIILASGLMAIGFIAFKFYKARTELNYHTL